MRIRLPWRKPAKYVEPKAIAQILDVEDTAEGLMIVSRLNEDETLPDYAYISSGDFKSLYGGNMDKQEAEFYDNEAKAARRGLCYGMVLGAAVWSIIIVLLIAVFK